MTEVLILVGFFVFVVVASKAIDHLEGRDDLNDYNNES